MRIRIEFTVDVDVDAYSEEFGIEREQVRDDVKFYAENTVRAQLDSLGLAKGGSA